MIKIDKKVPIPEHRVRSNKKYPFESMEVGNSFFIECPLAETYRTTANILSCFRNFKSYHPDKISWRITTRKVEGGIRCWRFE